MDVRLQTAAAVRRPWRWWLAAAAVVATGGVTAASVLGLAGSQLWLFDLLANFRLQYAGALLAATLALTASGHRRLTAGVGALLAVHLVPLAPLVLPADQPDGPGQRLRVVQCNVLAFNEDHQRVVAWLAAQDADVIVAVETTEAWAADLAEGLDGWRLLDTGTAQPGTFGLSVLVRDGLAVGDVEVVDRGATPAVAAIVGGGDQPLLLYGVHTLPPTRSSYVARARAQLDRAAEVVAGHDGPVVVVGDLNATRWSAPFRRFVEATGLRDSAEGQGLSGTWPSSLWFTGMIGIDHVLVSSGIRVDERRIGPDVGSDHRPVVVDLTVTG